MSDVVVMIAVRGTTLLRIRDGQKRAFEICMEMREREREECKGIKGRERKRKFLSKKNEKPFLVDLQKALNILQQYPSKEKERLKSLFSFDNG